METRLNRFIVLETANILESCIVLQKIDKKIREKLSSKPCNFLNQSYMQNDIDDTVQSAKVDKSAQTEENSFLMTYGSFLDETNKNKIKVQDIFLLALLKIKGLSHCLAVALSKKYQTFSKFKSTATVDSLKTVQVGKKKFQIIWLRKYLNMWVKNL